MRIKGALLVFGMVLDKTCCEQIEHHLTETGSWDPNAWFIQTLKATPGPWQLLCEPTPHGDTYIIARVDSAQRAKLGEPSPIEMGALRDYSADFATGHARLAEFVSNMGGEWVIPSWHLLAT